MLTKSYLLEQLQKYEALKQQSIDQANALQGAIAAVKALILDLEKPLDASTKAE